MVGGQLPTPGFEQYVPVYAAKAVDKASVERRETRDSCIVGVVEGQDRAPSASFCLAQFSGQLRASKRAWGAERSARRDMFAVR